MIPPVAIDLCKEFEGLHRVVAPGKLAPYICPAGVWTIGYGATGPGIRPGVLWTVEQAEARLISDLAGFTRESLRLCPVLAMYPDKLGAVVSFAFNLGSTRLAASTLRRRINEEDWPGAAEQLMRWVWGGGKRLPGLVRRRAAEAKVLLA